MNQVCVALDLETTGAKMGREEIIEVAAVKFHGDRMLGGFDTLVRPRGELLYRTQLLTGITSADLGRALAFRDVAGHLARFVGDFPIVGQSIPLDIDLLAREGLTLRNPLYDTYELASLLVSQLPNYSLITLAGHFGIDYPVRHRAMPDALVAKDVFLALYRLAVELDLPILTEIDRLASSAASPVRSFFQDAAKTKGRHFFSSSVGAQLAAKMGLDELNLDFLVHGSRKSDHALSPVSQLRGLKGEGLVALLQPGGKASQVFPGYEHRPEQIAMLQSVADAFNDESHLIVEAGTGTGKSLAYLLPAAAWALQNGRRVLISTNTINLQEQLLIKDIPDVESILFENDQESGPRGGGRQSKLQSVLVKGRSNYICMRRWSVLRRAESLSHDEIRLIIRILIWLRQTETGDRSELNLNDGELHVWSRVAAESDGCVGDRCAYERRGTCMLQRNRLAAESAHLVIVNHALLLADLANGSRILPEYEHVIIDEAHHLEDQATQQWGQEIGRQNLELVVDRVFKRTVGDRSTGLLSAAQAILRRVSLPPELKQRSADLLTAVQNDALDTQRCVRDFYHVLAQFVIACRTGSSDYGFRQRLTDAVRSRPEWAEVEKAWRSLRESIGALELELSRLREFLVEADAGETMELEDLRVESGTLMRSCKELRTRLDEAIVQPQAETVYWIGSDYHGQPLVCLAPLVVAKTLRSALFDKKRTAVLAGATLSTEGNFAFIRERLGLDAAAELILGSPFEYENSTLVYMVDDVPEPNKPGYQRAVDAVLTSIAKAAGGRTLALFTSRSALHASAAAIRPQLESSDILVLAHGIDGSRRQVLTNFRNNQRAVLLGTSSFWEGIDVVGDSLSVLVIAKLPFGVPTDPIFAARSELVEDAFNQYAVPRAILQFKQGFGRLIRSRSDRGVVVLLDRRLTTKQYGQAFQDSLPRCQVAIGPASEVPTAVHNWLAPHPSANIN